LLVDFAKKVGAARVATGHYARVSQSEKTGQCELRRGVDRTKDQSYFLFSLAEEALTAALFPLGELTKKEVRQIAADFGFANATRRESQDACFVMKEKGFAEALRLKFDGASRPGDIVGPDGAVLGAHQGIHHYTVGQRKGLGIAFGRRAYVCRIHGKSHRVVLSDDPSDLETDTLVASPLIWTGGISHRLPLDCSVQIRYRHAAEAARAEPFDVGLKVCFRRPVRAVAPGQAVVLFDGDRVLGGGWIDG
jgi:tRNA-specific 2-thiouridylase